MHVNINTHIQSHTCLPASSDWCCRVLVVHTSFQRIVLLPQRCKRWIVRLPGTGQCARCALRSPSATLLMAQAPSQRRGGKVWKSVLCICGKNQSGSVADVNQQQLRRNVTSQAALEERGAVVDSSALHRRSRRGTRPTPVRQPGWAHSVSWPRLVSTHPTFTRISSGGRWRLCLRRHSPLTPARAGARTEARWEPQVNGEDAGGRPEVGGSAGGSKLDDLAQLVGEITTFLRLEQRMFRPQKQPSQPTPQHALTCMFPSSHAIPLHPKLPSCWLWQPSSRWLLQLPWSVTATRARCLPRWTSNSRARLVLFRASRGKLQVLGRRQPSSLIPQKLSKAHQEPQGLLHVVSQVLWVLLLALPLALMDYHSSSSQSQGPRLVLATVNSTTWSTFPAILLVLGLPWYVCENTGCLGVQFESSSKLAPTGFESFWTPADDTDARSSVSVVVVNRPTASTEAGVDAQLML